MQNGVLALFLAFLGQNLYDLLQVLIHSWHPLLQQFLATCTYTNVNTLVLTACIYTSDDTHFFTASIYTNTDKSLIGFFCLIQKFLHSVVAATI